MMHGSNHVTPLPVSTPQLMYREKFLGCASPAVSCCCGCTLQNAIYSLSVAFLCFGSINLVASVSSYPALQVVGTVAGLSFAGLQLAFGICAWKAAAELRSNLVRVSLILFLIYLVWRIVQSAAAILYVVHPQNKEFVAMRIESAIEAAHNKPLTTDEKNIVHAAVTQYLYVVAATIGGFTCVFNVFAVYLLYILWSAKTRLEHRDVFTVCSGLPLDMHNAQFGYRQHEFAPHDYHHTTAPPPSALGNSTVVVPASELNVTSSSPLVDMRSATVPLNPENVCV
eukprot:Lankesteria_metandrocarpae@DN2558_c1_g1_i1.p1